MDLESLPDGIISNILARVPTLDLIGLKCVCKKWKSIIEEPHFHQLQWSCSSSNPSNNRVLMLQQCDRLFLAGLSDNTRVFKRELSYDISEYGQVKSHNGLLCYIDVFDTTIFIMNPFTNQYMPLPVLDDMECRYFPDTFGFVFDPTTNFYKVVVFVECDRSLPYDYECIVFDSGSKRWRSVGKPPYYIINRNPQVLVNERLHWMAGGYMEWDSIVSFDLTNDTFDLIRLPNDSLDNLQLMDFDGKLCIVNHYQQGQSLQLQIWVMKEYGVEESWANDFNIECAIPFEMQTDDPLHVVLMGELDEGKVLLICDQDTMLLYDLKGQEYEFLESKELPEDTAEKRTTASIHLANLCSINS